MLFLFNGNVSKYTKIIFVWTLFFKAFLSKLLYCRYTLLIILSDNVEVNLGRKCNTTQTPSISSYQRCSTKKDVLKNFTKFTGKQLCQSFFIKETPAQVFSWKFCYIFKNTFFTKYLFFTYSICQKHVFIPVLMTKARRSQGIIQYAQINLLTNNVVVFIFTIKLSSLKKIWYPSY